MDLEQKPLNLDLSKWKDVNQAVEYFKIDGYQIIQVMANATDVDVMMDRDSDGGRIVITFQKTRNPKHLKEVKFYNVKHAWAGCFHDMSLKDYNDFMRNRNFALSELLNSLAQAKGVAKDDFARVVADDRGHAKSTVLRWMDNKTSPHSALIIPLVKHLFEQDVTIVENPAVFKAFIKLFIHHNVNLKTKIAGRFSVNRNTIDRWAKGQSTPKDFARKEVIKGALELALQK